MKKYLKHISILILISSLSIIFLLEKTPEKKTIEAEDRILLRKANFSSLDSWKTDNFDLLIKGFKDSCSKILLEKNEYLSQAELKIPTSIYQNLCNKYLNNIPQTSEDFRQFIEDNFTPFLVTNNGNEEGKFTSYFESTIKASFIPNKQYKYPVYGKPYDLIEINLTDFDNSLPKKRLLGRIENQKLIPYYTRKEIENKKINAPILLWADSNIDIHIMQIQGSAVAKLENGKEIRISYADNNGHPFRGIGSILLSKGLIKSGQASMSQIKKWLEENPNQAKENLQENHRYIFHKLSNAEGPIGAQGVALHAGRSLAVDKKYIPLGSLLWLETTGPNKETIKKLVIAQDIGSAIKGIVRGDYFWGSGDDEILEQAGKMNSKGRYFILLPKEIEKDYE